MKKPLLYFGLALILIIFLCWIYLPPLSRYHELKLEEERIQAEIEKRDAMIEELRQEKELLKNDVEYLERIIRKELGLVKPGEVIYKFVSKESETAGSHEKN